MRPTLKVLALAGILTGFGGAADAQQAAGAPAPRASMGGAVAPRAGGGVTAILNARRVLDLTPRQVAQLDSIERVLHTERQRVTATLRPAMDSLRQRVRTEGVPRDSATRAQLRQQAEQRRATMRPQMEQLRQRDSASTAAAERLLTEAQRGKWRELQAERRGYQRGMREGRGPGGVRMMRSPDGVRMMRSPDGARMMRSPEGARPMRRPEGSTPPQMRRPSPDA